MEDVDIVVDSGAVLSCGREDEEDTVCRREEHVCRSCVRKSLTAKTIV